MISIIKKVKYSKFLYLLILIVCLPISNVTGDPKNLIFVGTIYAIRNKDIFTIEIDTSIPKEYLEKISHSLLYSVNSNNEIDSCFKPLYTYFYKNTYYTHILKIACSYQTLYPQQIIKGSKIYLALGSEVNSQQTSHIQQKQKDIPKIIIHPIDKKEMIYVPEDYLLFGQGDFPEDSSYNRYYYDWNLENIPKINAFYIDKYEVTNIEFLNFCIQTQYNCPDFLNSLTKEDYHKPYIYATYKDVENYARWAKKEIPTEWEWELAAKGGFNEFVSNLNLIQKGFFPEFPSNPENCNTLEKWMDKPQPMDVYQLKDINFRGIVGLCGNALEWTSSFFLPYPGFRFLNLEYQNVSGKFFRVLRGGSFYLPIYKAKVYTRIIGGNEFSNDPMGG